MVCYSHFQQLKHHRNWRYCRHDVPNSSELRYFQFLKRFGLKPLIDWRFQRFDINRASLRGNYDRLVLDHDLWGLKCCLLKWLKILFYGLFITSKIPTAKFLDNEQILVNFWWTEVKTRKAVQVWKPQKSSFDKYKNHSQIFDW